MCVCVCVFVRVRTRMHLCVGGATVEGIKPGRWQNGTSESRKWYLIQTEPQEIAPFPASEVAVALVFQYIGSYSSVTWYSLNHLENH